MSLTVYDRNGLVKGIPGTLYDSDQVGTVKAYAGATLPANWLLCDGRSLSRTAYADLFLALGGASTPWGLPDAASFNIPDMRGRTLIGSGTGVGDTGNGTGAITGGTALTARVMSAYGGEQTHTLSAAEAAQKNLGTFSTGNDTPDHSHSYTDASFNSFAQGNDGALFGNAIYAFTTPQTAGANTRHTHPLTISGSSATSPHNVMQPWVTVSWIIKAIGLQVDSGGALIGCGAAGAAGGQSYSQLIGDNLNTSFTVTHGFNTRGVSVAVYRTSSPYDEVECDVERTDLQTVIVRTSPTVPAVGEYTVVIAAPGTAATLDITMDVWHIVGAAGEPAFNTNWGSYSAVDSNW